MKFILLIIVSLVLNKNVWLSEKNKNFTLYYTSSDNNSKTEYKKFINDGIKAVRQFFNSSYNKDFSIYIHPSRHSLDSTWQHDWKMPDFHSECWMVASGVAGRLDMISPKTWDNQSCEHSYTDKTHTQQLITHELIHVFHGQKNSSPDFNNSEGIDWFVEGLASYASGQCDDSKIAEVKRMIEENKVPAKLDDFWKGKNRYWLSGSMVMFIDKKFGRKKLISLLSFTRKKDLLEALNLNEEKLLTDWRAFLQ